MSNVIVIGASGQLGQCLAVLVKEDNLEGFTLFSRAEANIVDVSSLKAAFREHSPVGFPFLGLFRN